MKTIYLLFILLIIGFMSCEDVKYAELPSIAPVTNLKATQSSTNNNIIVTWSAPNGVSAYNVLLNCDGNIDTLKNNPTTDTIINPVVNIEHAITVKVNTADGKVSDGVTARITISGPNPVSNFNGTRVGNDIVLSWTLPQPNTASQIELSYGSQIITLADTATMYVVSNTISTLKYTFGIRTKTATSASNYVYASVNSMKLAFITTYNSLSDLQQNGNNEEVAAANWFVATYPNGDVVSTSAIQNNTVDLSQYSVLWIDIDDPNTYVLPTALTNNTVVSKITTYYQNGGNLLLTTFATQYLVNLGRTSRLPSIVGSGAASFNGDIWDFNPNIGMTYNHFNNPIFAGLTIDNTSFTFPTIPLEGSGLKENHNCMWDLNSYGYQIPANGDNVARAFEIENVATVLATWGQVTDFCCAGIVDFAPTPLYKGQCIAIGLSAYEFNQSSGMPPYTSTNVYQSNIDKLTQNSINFLQ